MVQPEKNVRFSRSELRSAGIAMDVARKQKIPMDKRRKTCHVRYVKMLEGLNLSPVITQKPKKAKKSVAKPPKPTPKPAVVKEIEKKPAKKKTVPKAVPKAVPKPVAKKVTKTPKKTTKKSTKKSTTKKPAKTLEPTEPTLQVSKLEDLEGMAPRFLQKLQDLGVDSPAKLLDEDVKELAGIIKSTQKLIKAWKAQIQGDPEV